MKKRYVVLIILGIVFAFFVILFFSLKDRYSDKAALLHGEDYARVAVFSSDAEKFTFEDINSLRVGINSSLVEASHSSEGRLWYDAFTSFSKARVSDIDRAFEFESEKIVAGGDFFKLHSFNFLSGTRFSLDDNFSDRAVIDEEVSFKLFGSTNSVGMPLYIDSREFYVAGVIRVEDTDAWRAQFGESPVVIIPDYYEDANLYSVYEIVLPNPVSSYAHGVVSKVLGDRGEVVDVTDRFSQKSLFENLKNFKNRSFVTRPIAYPWFENTQRAREDTLSLVALFVCVSALAFSASCVYVIVRRKK